MPKLKAQTNVDVPKLISLEKMAADFGLGVSLFAAGFGATVGDGSVGSDCNAVDDLMR